jgi:hypothetical protein
MSQLARRLEIQGRKMEGGYKMEKWLLVAETNCSDPAREKEFNDWYNNVHVPDILETPGFINAIRYENNDPNEGRGKYLALYNLETKDIEKTMSDFTENVTKKCQQGRMSELVVAVSAVFYKQMTAPKKRK